LDQGSPELTISSTDKAIKGLRLDSVTKFLASDFYHESSYPRSLIVTPVVHPELRIPPRIFEKLRNGAIGIIRGFGEYDS
jgi:hypothetical protein